MHTFSSHRWMLAGALVSVLTASPAAAQLSVDPATYSVTLYGGNILGGQPSFTATAPGNYQFAYPQGSVAASIQIAPFTLLTAHANTFAFCDCFGSVAGASMNYYFRILGPEGTRVSATFTADMFASLALSAEDEVSGAVSQFDIFSPIGGVGSFYDASGAVLSRGPTQRVRQFLAPGTSRFNAPVGFIVDANALYQVQLFASARTEAPNTANAYIDPVITIDPAFQGRYSLLLSPGVSNLGPNATTITPEPGSVALLGAGLLGVAGFARRRLLNRATRNMQDEWRLVCAKVHAGDSQANGDVEPSVGMPAGVAMISGGRVALVDQFSLRLRVFDA